MKGGRTVRRSLPAVALIVLHLERGEPDEPLVKLSVDTIRGALERASRKAALPHITPHVLRATASVIHRELGANPWDIRRLMGHVSIEHSIRYADRVFPQRQDPVASAILELWESKD